MWNTAGLAGQACAHLPDSERHGLQMCQLGGSGGEERAVNRLRLPPWGPALEQSPSLALPPPRLQSCTHSRCLIRVTLRPCGWLEGPCRPY